MLILSRKPEESLIITADGQEEPVEIVVTEINPGQVRLGIRAPKGCKIWRKELYLTAQYNKQAAAVAPAAGIQHIASTLAGAGKTAAYPGEKGGQ